MAKFEIMGRVALTDALKNETLNFKSSAILEPGSYALNGLELHDFAIDDKVIKKWFVNCNGELHHLGEFVNPAKTANGPVKKQGSFVQALLALAGKTFAEVEAASNNFAGKIIKVELMRNADESPIMTLNRNYVYTYDLV